jgi:DeoR/GlpR family transcriptional regulator of sugar metabolism
MSDNWSDTPVNDHRISGTALTSPSERQREILDHIRRKGRVSIADVQTLFGVSAMTARRDLEALDRVGLARRTRGGATVRGFTSHDETFEYRLTVRADAKRRLAAAFVKQVASGQAVFLDSSTTSYYVASELLSGGGRATVVTNSTMIAQLVGSSDVANIELIVVGGLFRRVSCSCVGPTAVNMIRQHQAAQSVTSVTAVLPDGGIADPDPLEAELKRAMIERSAQPSLLVDGSKFNTSALHVIANLTEFAQVLVADPPTGLLSDLEARGVQASAV